MTTKHWLSRLGNSLPFHYLRPPNLLRGARNISGANFGHTRKMGDKNGDIQRFPAFLPACALLCFPCACYASEKKRLLLGNAQK